MAYIVNSSPGAGFRFEPSVTFDEPKDAINHAASLSSRGMRMIKIKDTVSGAVFDAKSFAQHLQQKAAAQNGQ